MRSRIWLVALAVTFAMAAPAMTASRSAEQPAVADREGEVVALRLQIEGARALVKSTLSHGELSEEQVELALDYVESWVQSYSSMALTDSSADSLDTMQQYIDGKLIPHLDEMGLSLISNGIAATTADWARANIQLRKRLPDVPSDAPTHTQE